MGTAHRAAIFLTASVSALSSCAHPYKVVKKWEQTSVVEGTRKPDLRKPGQARLYLLPVRQENIVYDIEVEQQYPGTEDVNVDTLGLQKCNPYQGPEFVGKPVLAAIAFALFAAPTWFFLIAPEERRPDHDGNGKYDAGEYLFDLASWFNPFSASPIPSSKTTERQVLLERRSETREVTVKEHLIDHPVTATVIAVKTSRRVAARSSDKGVARLDLGDAFMGFLCSDVKISFSAPHPVTGKNLATKATPVPCFDACEMVRNRYGKGPFLELGKEPRQKVVAAYRSKAGEILLRGDLARASAVASLLHELFPDEKEARELASDLSIRKIRNLFDAQDLDAGHDEMKRCIEKFPECKEALRSILRSEACSKALLTMVLRITKKTLQLHNFRARVVSIEKYEKDYLVRRIQEYLEAGADPNLFRVKGYKKLTRVPIDESVEEITVPANDNLVIARARGGGLTALGLALLEGEEELAILLRKHGAEE